MRYQPIYLDVANIEFVEEYKSPMRSPYVEHLIPYSPSEAMHIWVKDRLRTVGLDKTLQVIIKDASVIATELPKPDGITGFFTDSQDWRYDAKLDVEMRIYGEGAMSEASIDVSATQSTTISEKASALPSAKPFSASMIADLMESANAELEKNMFKYFSKYISYSQTP